jgi:hypothetical protein
MVRKNIFFVCLDSNRDSIIEDQKNVKRKNLHKEVIICDLNELSLFLEN